MSRHETHPGLLEDLAAGLRRAAAEAASDGRPELGAAYLRQAIALLPPEPAQAALAELARLETLYDMPSAVEHFGALVEASGSLEVLADAASALLALNPSSSDEHVWVIARDAIAECQDRDQRLRLLSRIGVAAALALGPGVWRDQVVADLRGHGAVTPGERAAFGVTLFVDLWQGRPLGEVRTGAEQMFRGDWLAAVIGNDAAFGLGMTALLVSDSPLLPQVLEEGLAFSREHAASGYEGGILAVRAHARLRAGDLLGAAADADAAFRTYRSFGGGPVPLAYALAALIEAQRLLGDLDAARRALARAPSDADAGTLGLPGIRFARALLRADAGAEQVALDELTRIGAGYVALGGNSPALLPWRSQAALIAKRIGHDPQARELAEEELAACAGAGERALGRALAVHAAVGPPARARAVAAEAVSVLERAGAPLELATALVVEGRACAAAGGQAQARQAFARALELAERAGARPLAGAAREALVAAGGRPRRSSVGVDGLTPAEHAVARAAARGLSNREIASELFLAPGTVKNQLASAYRKLAVSSRSQLADALGAPESSGPAAYA